MKTIQLTRGYAALVSSKDFKRVSQHKWHVHLPKLANGTVRPYAVRSLPRLYGGNPRRELMHRFILGVTDSKVQVDHKDTNGLHNWRGNLRKATNQQNSRNRGKNSNNTSGFKGVSWDKRRNVWISTINVSGRQKYLGRFTSAKLASKAYAKAVKFYHKEFGRTA